MDSDAPATKRLGKRTAGAWVDAAWPVLAGMSTAVGLLGIAHIYGFLGLILIPTGLWILAAICIYGVLSESGLSRGRAARVALAGTLVVVVLMGWLLIFPRAGWIPVTLVGLTSPPVCARATRFVRRRRSTLVRSRRSGGTDQAAVDRRFAQIVSELRTDPSWGPEGH